MDFVLGELRSNPSLTFEEIKTRAQLNGIAVFPIVFGLTVLSTGVAVYDLLMFAAGLR